MTSLEKTESFDAIVVGGGPSGATAAADLARGGHAVLLLDRAGRIKPCGGAIPPRLIDEFAIPDHLLVAKVTTARMISPKAKAVDIPIKDGFVGMVDRDEFDEYLRNRAVLAGARRIDGTFEGLEHRSDGMVDVHFRAKEDGRSGRMQTVRARAVIGADGANSAVGRAAIPGAKETPFVFAYHEIIDAPDRSSGADYDATRAEVWYNGDLSPDFYSWVFPHGKAASVGTGSAHKGFSLKGSVGELREISGLDRVRTIRKEGAPIPLEPLKVWDDGRNVVLAGDAAGIVAPASGEGIYYAMAGGRFAADAVQTFLLSGKPEALKAARKAFMRKHGNVFWVLGMMQRYWYTTDDRRERFVAICRDRDVQELTFEAYMQKELVKARPLAHVRIFFKNIAHLSGLVPA